MGTPIKYKGLADGPLLVTPTGKYPPIDIRGTGDAPLYATSLANALHTEIKRTEQVRVLGEVRRRVDELAFMIDNLHVPSTDNLEDVRTAVSSSPLALPATADQLATPHAVHTVEVEWPAKTGEVLTPPMNPIATVDLAPGDYTFSFTIDGEDHAVTVAVNQGDEPDTQEVLLSRLARAINTMDYRVAAEVSTGFVDAYDPTPNTRPMNRVVRLRVYGTEEGRGVDFSFSEDSPGLVAAYKLNQGLPPRSASIRQESVLTSRDTNDVSLDEGHVTAVAQANTAGPAEIRVSRGPGVISRELVGVVAKYNEIMGYLDSQTDLLSPSLKDRLVRPLENESRVLDALGLSPTPQGRLKISETFTDNIQYNFGKVRQDFLAEGGWVDELAGKLQQIQEMDPEAFASHLEARRPSLERAVAWDLVFSLSHSIVSGNY
ncbi:MAG: hypothetical protein KQJ78_03540 [Deltaproteobacteria bacterium]|nr:hypothetical protein [Deltaproteobacteria bacterium]